MLVTQPVQENRAHHAEYRGVRSYSERERETHNGNKSRTLRQFAGRVADVAEECVDLSLPSGIAHVLLDSFKAAEFEQRHSPRFRGSHTLSDVILDLLLQMKAQLLIEPFLCQRFAKQAPEPSHVNAPRPPAERA